MEMSNRLLVVRAALDVSSNETQAAAWIARLHKIESLCVDKKIGQALPQVKGKFSLVYLAAHGDDQNLGFDAFRHESWSEVATWLCGSVDLQEDSIIFVASCHGGALSVAESIFANCPKVLAVVGCAGIAKPPAISLAFHAVLYSYIVLGESVCESARRAAITANLPIECRTFLEVQPQNEN
jgi:hypothetical protein